MKKWMMLLVVSMLLIMAPMSVAAAGKTITGLGTGTIGKPVVPTSENDYWSGSHVYFGSKSTPILFNVLKVGETNFGGNTMLLDCASILQTMRFDDDSNQWVNSEIKTWLNGTFLSARFTDREQQAIAGSTKNSYVVALTGEKVFLLDADEVMSDSYGFFQRNGPDNYTRKKYDTSNGLWWLRSSKLSQGNNTQADYVSTNGGLSNSSFNYTEIGVSPSLNVKLADILFSSLVSGTAGQAGAEYKLTLLDSKMVVAEGSAGIARSGNTITVPYSISGDNAGNANHVSLLITNKDDGWTAGWNSGAVKQYYTTTAVTTNHTVTFTLPNNYEANRANWKVWLLAEQVNGEKKTDYASAPKEISIPYQLKYDSNGGSGTMASESVYEGNQFTFPECKFSAPNHQTFDHWKMSGVDGIFYAPNSTVQIASNCAQNGVITVTAHWKDAPQATINPVPQAKNLTYNGSAQELVTAGAAEGGTMYYAIGTDGTTAPTSGWSTSIPTGTEARTYYVWYKAIGDADHSDSDPASTKADIGKKSATVTAKAQTVNEGGSIKKGTDQAVLSDAVEGHKLSKITLTVTDNKIVPSGAKIIDKNKKDVTGNYDISYVDGALTTKKTISAKVTFKVVNGSWDDGTAADKTVTLKGNEGDTLKLAAKDIPSVGSKPNTGYKAGGWDVIPSTDTAITKDTTYKYTYANGGVDPSPEPTTETTPAPTKTAEPTPEPTVTQEPITIPKTPSGVKATAKKEKVTVTWNKIKKTKKTKALRAQIKSIQVQYATDASFTQNVGTKTVGKGKTKTTIKLERKTVYYVRVRYVGADGVSAWSKVKRVKTK